jgi:hypothetical protein
MKAQVRAGELTGNPAVINLTGARKGRVTMFVDTELLHSGANESHRAGGHAQDGADHLSRGPLVSGMFGEFATAEAFHDAVRSAHAQHVQTLQAHQEALTAVGSKAHRAAIEFTGMDHRNAAEQRAVRYT